MTFKAPKAASTSALSVSEPLLILYLPATTERSSTAETKAGLSDGIKKTFPQFFEYCTILFISCATSATGLSIN